MLPWQEMKVWRAGYENETPGTFDMIDTSDTDNVYTIRIDFNLGSYNFSIRYTLRVSNYLG